MANTRISDLTASASNLAASDLVPVVQTPGVGPVKMTGTQIKTGIIGAGSVSIASGKTFTSSNTLTLAGTDSTTMTFPSTSATLARTDAGNTFTGAQTFSVGTVNGTGLDITQTWGGTGTYSGLKYNVTDSGPSNAASLLLDMGIGGGSYVSKFTVDKVGVATSRTTLAASSYTVSGGYRILDNAGGGIKYSLFYSDTSSRKAGFFTATDSTTWPGFVFSVSSGMPEMFSLSEAVNNGGGICFPNGLTIGNQSVGTIPANSVALTGNTATLQLGAADTTGTTAPTAQFLRVQSWSSSTNNNQTGANFTIQGSRGTGTGAGGSIIFQVAPAGSSGTAQNAYSTALTINSAQTVTFASSGGAALSIGPGGGPILSGGVASYDFGNGASNSGTVYARVNDTRVLGINSTSVMIPAANTYAFGTVSGMSGDVFLARDAASTLALRNGTSAQTYRIYATASGSPGADFQRLTLSAGVTANMAVVAADNGGTGVAMGLQFGAALTTGGGVTNIMNINTSGHLVWNTDNTYDIGASGANRPRNIYVATSVRTDSFYTTSTAGFYYILNRFSLQSAADGTVYFTNAAGTDFNRLQFGGTASSFPALKRISSGNCLQVIAADNTASAGFIVGNQALATSATDGFLYVPTCAGTPTGTPTTQTGTAPIVVDTTNNKLYFYSGGAWRDAGP